MIKIIHPKDIVFEINISNVDINSFQNLSFDVYTESTSKDKWIHLDKERLINNQLYINESELQNLETGTIFINVNISIKESNFIVDSTYDPSTTLNTNTYLIKDDTSKSKDSTDEQVFSKYQQLYDDLNNKVDSNEDKIVKINDLASNIQASIDKVNEKNNEQDSSIGQNRVDINTNKDNITNTKANLSDYTLYEEFDQLRSTLSKINNVE